MISAFAVQEILVLGRGWFVKLWTNSYETEGTHVVSLMHYTIHVLSEMGNTIHVAQAEKSVGYWIGMYAAISLLVCFPWAWVGAGGFSGGRGI